MSTEVDPGLPSQNYNEKVLSHCSFITKEFLENVLRKRNNNPNVEIVDWDVTAAVGAGDNYLSFLYRTKINFINKPKKDIEKCQLMIKGCPSSKFLITFIEQLGIFRKELAMYSKCLPLMKSYQEEYFPEDTKFVAAESYECDLPNTIIMEDLSEGGYKMANRRQQLDYDHCFAALKSLARFHALSVKIYETQPEIIDSVSYEFYQEENRDKLGPFIDLCFPNVCNVMETWPESSRFVPILRRIGTNGYDKVIENVKPTEGSLTLLNHGDMWVNNMLFKYDESNKVEHAKLVDFQIARYSSPSIDLLYFLFTSPKAEVLTTSMDKLIEEYHNHLIADLKQLGIECDYTIDQLHKEMRERAFFAVMVIITILPMIVANPEDALDMDTINEEELQAGKFEGEFPLLKNYQAKYFRETIGKFLLHMENIGYLKDAEERMQHLNKEQPKNGN